MAGKPKKRLLILALVLAALLAWLWQAAGYIPLAGAPLAKSRLTAYARQAGLPDELSVKFNWYDGHYDALPKNSGEPYPKVILQYHFDKGYIMDAALTRQINEQAEKDYAALKESFDMEGVTLAGGIHIYTGVSSKDYTQKTQRLYLPWCVNEAPLTPEESQAMPALLARRVMDGLGEGYNFTAIQLEYADRNGMYEIIIPISGFEPLTDEALREATAPVPPEDWHLNYKDWRAAHGFD